MADPQRGRGSPRQQEKRDEKLADIKRQVADGSLVIRKMSAKEKKKAEKKAETAREARAKRPKRR
jgi:hypothetical protein